MQFSEHPGFVRKLQTTLVDQSSCSFRTWGTSLLAVFERSKIATTLVGPVFLQFSNIPGFVRNCNNTGGLVLLDDGLGGPFFFAVFEHPIFEHRICSKTATTLVDQSSWIPGLGGPVFLQFSNIRVGTQFSNIWGCGDQVSGLWAGFRV